MLYWLQAVRSVHRLTKDFMLLLLLGMGIVVCGLYALPFWLF